MLLFAGCCRSLLVVCWCLFFVVGVFEYCCFGVWLVVVLLLSFVFLFVECSCNLALHDFVGFVVGGGCMVLFVCGGCLLSSLFVLVWFCVFVRVPCCVVVCCCELLVVVCRMFLVVCGWWLVLVVSGFGVCGFVCLFVCGCCCFVARSVLFCSLAIAVCCWLLLSVRCMSTCLLFVVVSLFLCLSRVVCCGLWVFFFIRVVLCCWCASLWLYVCCRCLVCVVSCRCCVVIC